MCDFRRPVKSVRFQLMSEKATLASGGRETVNSRDILRRSQHYSAIYIETITSGERERERKRGMRKP